MTRRMGKFGNGNSEADCKKLSIPLSCAMRTLTMRTVRDVFIGLAWTILLATVLNGCGDFGDIKTGPPVQPLPPPYNWSSQNSMTTSRLNDVFFIDGTRGWVVGDSITLLASNDGGVNWPQVPSTSIIRNLRSVFFVSPQTGWMSSGSNTGPDGHVFISKMGGAYPTVQDMVDRPLNTIFFLDKNTGWAAGDSSIIIQTDDGGVSWTRSLIGTQNKIFDLHFFTREMGWAATSNGGIYRTKDGTDWKKEDLGITSDIRAIHFVDTLHGWACGASNKIFRRQLDLNNKVIWTISAITSESSTSEWCDIFFVSEQTGWIIGSRGVVYKTIDGGTTWNQESTSVLSPFNAIYMVSATKGWIVGDGGTILTYTP